MRILKLMTIGFMLALTSGVYAAGAMQDAAKPQGAAKAEKSCCRMKHEGAQTSAHKGMKHGGETCCGSESCCAGGACDMKHKGGHATTAVEKSTTGEQTAGCCSSDSCGGGSCMMKHKETSAATHAHATASCCTDVAACCQGDGVQACCKAHKSDTKKAAAAAKSGDKRAASCCGASCSCCGKHAGQAAQAAAE